MHVHTQVKASFYPELAHTSIRIQRHAYTHLHNSYEIVNTMICEGFKMHFKKF